MLYLTQELRNVLQTLGSTRATTKRLFNGLLKATNIALDFNGRVAQPAKSSHR